MVATAALAVMIGLAPIAEATVLKGLTLSGLRSGAELVVEGRVTKVRTEMRDGRIETIAVVRVGSVHKGEASRRIEVRMLGGRHRGMNMVVPGAARMSKGDDVLLFLYGSADAWRPVGMFQGVWQVDSDGVTARASHSGGATLMRPDNGDPAVDRAELPVSRLVGQGGAR